MSAELIDEIQKLILMASCLLFVIGLFITLLSFVLEYYFNFLKSKEIVKRDEHIKFLKERLYTKTELDRLRYEHEQFIKDYMKDEKN